MFKKISDFTFRKFTVLECMHFQQIERERMSCEGGERRGGGEELLHGPSRGAPKKNREADTHTHTYTQVEWGGGGK